MIHAAVWRISRFGLAVNAITRAGCWAHARRKFVDAEKAAPEIAAEAAAFLRTLYAVEKQAREDSVEERLQLRQAKSLQIGSLEKVLSDQLIRWCCIDRLSWHHCC